MRHLVLPLSLSLSLSLGACGNHPTAGGAPEATPAASPTPAAAAPAPLVAAGPPSSCSLGPASVVASGRGHAEVVSDGRTVAVTHRIRHRPEEDFCTATYAVASTALPLTASSTWEAKIPLMTCGDLNLFAHVTRTELGLAMTSCALVSDPGNEEPGTGDVTCRVGFLGAAHRASEHVLDPGGLLDGAKAGMAIGVSGQSYFAAAAIVATGEHDGVRGFFVDGATAAIPVDLGRAATGMDLANPEQYVIDIRPRDGGGFVVEHGATAIARRVRTEIDARGARATVPTPVAITLPPAPAIAFATEHGEHGAPSHVRIRRAGTPAPLIGIDDTIATFAPRFGELRGRYALAWSEGTGRTTRIRFALVDPAAGAIVGAPLEVSTPSVEAGYSSLFVVDDHVLVAWDENDGGIWDVRVAELSCR